MNSIEKILQHWLNPVPQSFSELYMVGGSVRDKLLGVFPKDIDLICKDPEKTAKQLAKANNAACVPFLKKPDEPCYRVADRKSPENFIDIALMRGSNLLSDLKSRDFTINAMAIKIKKNCELGEIIDPLNGIIDLKNGIIKMTGPNVFFSDPLRMLRAFRFGADLNYTIEQNTMDAIQSHVDKIKFIASERILYELFAILKARNSYPFVNMMDELGILDAIFPEIIPMKNCTQNGYHNMDVWNHCLETFRNCENIINNIYDYFGLSSKKIAENFKIQNKTALLKMGAILHDIGKPAHRKVKTNGKITFYGHQKTSADFIDIIAKRLRMSKRDHKFLHIIVSEHMQVLNLSKPNVKALTLMRWFRKLEDNVIPLIIHSMADIMSTTGPDSSEKYRDDYLKWAKETAENYYEIFKSKIQCKNLINGKDLIAMGMKPGPELGKILKKIQDAQYSGKINNREQALNLAQNLFLS